MVVQIESWPSHDQKLLFSFQQSIYLFIYLFILFSYPAYVIVRQYSDQWMGTSRSLIGQITVPTRIPLLILKSSDEVI